MFAIDALDKSCNFFNTKISKYVRRNKYTQYFTRNELVVWKLGCAFTMYVAP